MTSATGEIIDGNAIVKVDYKLPAGNQFLVTYKIYPDGIMNVATHFTPAHLDGVKIGISEATATATFSPGRANVSERDKMVVPRIGVRFRLPATMDQLEYFGRGPLENYWDRKAGYMIGQYKSTAEEQYFPYVRPQENGHHCDTRWISLGGKGKNLLIVADDEMEFNAMRNSVEDFDAGKQPTARTSGTTSHRKRLPTVRKSDRMTNLARRISTTSRRVTSLKYA